MAFVPTRAGLCQQADMLQLGRRGSQAPSGPCEIHSSVVSHFARFRFFKKKPGIEYLSTNQITREPFSVDGDRGRPTGKKPHRIPFHPSCTFKGQWHPGMGLGLPLSYPVGEGLELGGGACAHPPLASRCYERRSPENLERD